MDAARVKLSRAELRDQLVEQITLLVSHCEQFDKGEQAFAKAIAVVLRVCLHHGGRSNSLLQQLDLRGGIFFTTFKRINSQSRLIGCALVRTSYDPEKGGHFVPILEPLTLRARLPFPEWWTGIILRAPTGIVMSRMDIVRAVADTDGGAHVDAGLEETYALFRSGRLLALRVIEGENAEVKMHIPIQLTQSAADQGPFDGLVKGAEYPSLRTVAHEFLLTMQKRADWCFKRPYVPPVIGAI